MGVESDQEIVQLIGPEPAFIPLLIPTLQESKQLGIYTQQQALDYIGIKPIFDASWWLPRSHTCHKMCLRDIPMMSCNISEWLGLN